MTTALSATIEARIKAKLTNAGDLSDEASTINELFSLALADGTGTGKANAIWSDTRTIAASSSENLDLAGVLADAFGNALTFTKVKAIMVKAAAANTNDVHVGGAASNGFTAPFADATDIAKVKPGGVFLWVYPAGATVTASTGDILKMANSSSGTGVTYDIIIVGEQ